MRTLVLGAALVLALALAATAAAGGWATVGVAPLPPDQARTDWNVQITVLRHGRTPTAGAKPIVIIRNADSGQTLRFPAKPTAKTGVYRARVVFPSGGTWRYEVNDGLEATGYGMSRTHSFAAVELAGAADSGSSFAWKIAGGTVLALALGALLLVGLRRRRPASVPAPTG